MSHHKSELVWFEIPASNLERAKAFYSELMGWGFKAFGAPGEEATYYMIENEGASVSGGMYFCEKIQAGAVKLYFKTPNIEKSLERAKSLKAKVVQQKTMIAPDIGYFAEFLDSEGNSINFWSQD